ncbi:MAG: tetratricopeptide repeat protein, partial [Pseudomonadota bacterium]
YSLAEHLGLSTQFQRVHIPEYWDQSQGYSLLTGHVNLILKQPQRKDGADKVYFFEPTSLTVDFDPNSREQHFKTSKISKDRITAMFYNNKGAMHMIKGEYDLAYSYFRAAIEFDINYSGAWGNLGILYRLNHMHDLAEQTYQHALLVNPENNTVLGNTALLYRLTNRIAQAEKIEADLESKRRNNPYYMIVKGNEALAQDELNSALHFFNAARKLDKNLHDSYFGLAKVYYYRGNLSRAEGYLKLALKNAEFKHDKKRYQGKLVAFKYLALRESS